MKFGMDILLIFVYVTLGYKYLQLSALVKSDIKLLCKSKILRFYDIYSKLAVACGSVRVNFGFLISRYNERVHSKFLYIGNL